VLLFVPAWVSCRWEARLPVHQQEGERTQVPRDREEDPGGELCGSLCSGIPVMVPRVVFVMFCIVPAMCSVEAVS
jgi:hypothetical protein